MANNTKKVYSYGLSELAFGDIAEDGGIATTFAALGFTEEDSCTFTQEDPEETEIFAEEVDDPVIVLKKDGKFTLEATLMNPSLEVMQKICGGTISEDGEWQAPTSTPDIELSCRITPKQGFIISVPRMKITASVNNEAKKNALGWKLVLKGTVLTPKKSGEAKLYIKEVEKA